MQMMRCVTFMMILMLSATAWAQDSAVSGDRAAPQSVKPGINEAFLDPQLDVEAWVNRFEVESREVFQAKREIVERVKLSPGDRIVDIGTGTGLFVEPFSQAVGDQGWVYAVDIAPKFVERVEKLAEIRGLHNVTPVLCSEDDIRLAPGSINAAFICDVYHHFEYPHASLASIHKALKPGGKLIVIDFERIPGESRVWTLDHVRAGKEVFRAEIEKAGFRFVNELEVPSFKENYFLQFERK